MMLDARDVSLTRGDMALLRQVDLKLQCGEVLAVLGPNGAGKTSLLRVLTGLWQPSAGEVEFNGRPLSQWQARRRAQLMAVLPQHPVLDFAFTVEEVLLLGRIPHASGRVRDREIVAAAMAQTDISHLRQRDFCLLSGGEKQRVHLARVLAQIWEPMATGERLLVLDEPAASLDLAHQQLLVATVRDLASRGIAVLLVLHDINMAVACANRLLFLRGGTAVAAGTAEEVVRADLVREIFAVDITVTRHAGSGAPMVLPW